MLHHRGTVLYSRLIVPRSLRPLIGRCEIWKSLRTTDRPQGKLRAQQWEGHLSRLFLHLHQHGHTMTPEQIEALVQRYITDTLQAGEDERVTRKVSADEQEAISLVYADELAETQGALTANDFTKVSPIADSLLQSHDVALEKSSEDYRRLCRELLKAQQHVFRIEMERWEGNYSVPQPNVSPAPPPPTQITSPPFSQAIGDYLTYIKDRAPATLREKQRVLQKFAEAIGDKPLATYTKRDLITYRDKLAHEVSRTGKPPSRSRVNTVLIHLSAFFSWAIKHDHCLSPNPADGISYEGVESQSYDSFTDADLSLIFGSPEYQAQRTAHPERYWLPLILLFTGARREEIAGLPLDDLVHDRETDIRYFRLRFNPDTGRRLKNKASIRRVPVHSALLKLGFMDYVRSVSGATAVRSTGAAILFPTNSKARPTAGDAIGKWFARLLKQVFPTDKRKLTLHSLRSTATTRLHERGIKGEIVRALVGHSGGDIHEDKYLKRDSISLTVLRDAIEQLDFPLPSRLAAPEKPAAKALSHALTWSRRS